MGGRISAVSAIVSPRRRDMSNSKDESKICRRQRLAVVVPNSYQCAIVVFNDRGTA
jgi:hypothetical protein